MIDLRAVCVTFQDASDVVRAVDQVTFSASAGDLVVIGGGASGSGKSTLLNVMAGLQRSDSGDADIAGGSISAGPGGSQTSPDCDSNMWGGRVSREQPHS